jgi:hypothetical protein
MGYGGRGGVYWRYLKTVAADRRLAVAKYLHYLRLVLVVHSAVSTLVGRAVIRDPEF